MLRINRDVSKQDRLNRIDEIIDFVRTFLNLNAVDDSEIGFFQQLNLKKAEDTVIGVPGRIKGLSGGEKRRLMFASEV